MYKGPRKTKTYDAETVNAFRSELGKDHFEVLMAVTTTTKYEVLAARLLIPVGTVRSRLNRARLKLAKLIAEQAVPESEATV